MHKFCQVYDENIDGYAGGYSLCDMISCFLTCGKVFKQQRIRNVQADDLDFRKRFEKGMERLKGEPSVKGPKARGLHTSKTKSVGNYLSSNAKLRQSIVGPLDTESNERLE